MKFHLPVKHDITLGHLVPGSPLWRSALRLDRQAQGYHGVIWGQSGAGKSRLLQSIFLQHIQKGHGVGILEPHHDLSFDSLTSLISQGFFQDEHAFEKLVYIDWGNDCYVPFNVLAGEGEPEDVALAALDAMLRVWPELSQGPLFKRLFLSSITVLIVNHYPITSLYKFLTDADFRHACLGHMRGSPITGDLEALIQDTFGSYDGLGRDQMSAAGSTLNRAFALSFHRATRLTLGQSDNWLNFRKWMDEGKSFIINLGNINDEETRKLVGAMVMVQIEQAALSRKTMLPSQRTPLTLLVDEWPSFAAQAETLGPILEQARKFNLRLYLAGQSLAQVSSERLSGALENCKVAVVFGLGRDSAEIQAKHIGTADPFTVKEEARTETQHNQYLSVPEQFQGWAQDIQNLPTRFAWVKVGNGKPKKIRTLNVPDARANLDEIQRVLGRYKQLYQRSREEALAATASAGSPLPNEDALPGPAYKHLFGGRAQANHDPSHSA